MIRRSYSLVHIGFSLQQNPMAIQDFCVLNHWGLVMHICICNLTIIASDNGMLPVRRQAIIRTNAGILLSGTLGTNVSEILIQICTFSFKNMHLKMSSGKWQPFCLGLNVLIVLIGLNVLWCISCSLCCLFVVNKKSLISQSTLFTASNVIKWEWSA